MRKSDWIIVIALFALWLAWGYIDRTFFVPMFGSKNKPVPQQPANQAPTQEVASATGEVKRVQEKVPVLTAPKTPVTNVPPAVVEEPAVDVEEAFVTLATNDIEITFSSHGASISKVKLTAYSKTLKEKDEPVELDFSSSRSLALVDIPGLGENHAFSIQKEAGKPKVVFSRKTASGLSLTRAVTITDRYRLEIKELFKNETGQVIELPRHQIKLGPMGTMPGETQMMGVTLLGVDTLSPGDKVRHWSKKLLKWTKDVNGPYAHKVVDSSIDWVACKNKYFTQSLVPVNGAKSAFVHVYKPEGAKYIEYVYGAAGFEPAVLQAGGQFGREMSMYIGPKKLNELEKVGMEHARIMELGWMTPIGELLLKVLIFIEGVVGNYGVAIMLLTIMIKVLFWPITHKGTESMRRMQEYAPMIKQIGEKYKDNAQKKQQEIMAFYKKNKINPLGGCLPMVIQIPVFIGLFYVLRSAIELRFADFLWISDLSEPERIIPFGFTVPFVGWDALNILPILMVVTMIIQMKVAPTSAPTDEQQAQMQAMMMKVMPIMMLFLLYNFASGLALYWTTQNILMIGQQLLYKKRKAIKDAKEKEAAGG